MEGRRRLQRFLSQAGVCSRRSAEKLIRAGRVLVDGRPATIGQQVDPAVETVEVDGRVVSAPGARVYLLYHKPLGVLSTRKDPFGRPTVSGEVASGRYLYPVGRLDLRSSGALLLTDDGALTHRLLHPKGVVEKVYRVKVVNPLTRELIRISREVMNR